MQNASHKKLGNTSFTSDCLLWNTKSILYQMSSNVKV